MLLRTARHDTLIPTSPVPAAAARVVFPRTDIRVAVRAGPFRPLREASYGLLVTDAQGDLTLRLVANDRRTLARCSYPRGTYPFVPYDQSTLLVCPLPHPERLDHVVLTARHEPRGLVVDATETNGTLAGGYLLQPQHLAERESKLAAALARLGAARPHGLGGVTFVLALGLSLAAAAAAAVLALGSR